MTKKEQKTMKEFEVPICKKCGKPIEIIRKPNVDNFLNVEWDWDNHICDKKIKKNKSKNKKHSKPS